MAEPSLAQLAHALAAPMLSIASAAEEMWTVLGHSGSLAYEPWPQADESLLVQNTYNLPVQVNSSVVAALFCCCSSWVVGWCEDGD